MTFLVVAKSLAQSAREAELELRSAIHGWMSRGLCRETDPEIFFPERGESTTAARETCNRCEVLPECAIWSLKNGEDVGVWGGMTAPKRAKIVAGGQIELRRAIEKYQAMANARDERIRKHQEATIANRVSQHRPDNAPEPDSEPHTAVA